MKYSTSPYGNGQPATAFDVAMLAHRLGLSPLIPLEDGSKAPARQWRHLEDQAASETEIQEWFSRPQNSIGLVTGYNGLECLEFDDRETYLRFIEAAQQVDLGDLVEGIRHGYEEVSPSGGVHWFYYCSELRGNTKLAERPDAANPGKRKVLIETRGRGGFVIIAPSRGAVHPSGGAYRLVSGGLRTILQISDHDRDQLWDLARTFDEMTVQSELDPPAPKEERYERRPGDIFAEQTSWEAILEPAGWTKVFTRGDVTYWRRPGKDRSYSATTGYCKGLKVFSSSTPFPTQGTVTKFQAYAILNHGGSFTEAARSLIARGYSTSGYHDPGTNGTAPRPEICEAHDDPHRLARIFLIQRCWHAGRTTLVYHRGEFHRWEGAAYRAASDHELAAGITVTTKAEFDRLNVLAVEAWEKGGKVDRRGNACEAPQVQKVTKPLVGNVDQALKGLSLIPFSSEPPLWLIDSPPFPAADVLPARNALVHLPSFVAGKDGAIVHPTPNFFCPYALDYDFDPNPPCPQTLIDFLVSVWPKDQESVDALQEWFGYLLTLDKSQHKMAVLIGPPRSGRGTVCRLIRKLIGANNVVNPTLSGLATPFGAECLIDKPVAIIGDARQSNRGDWAVALERILGITGDDSMTIARKHRPDWTGELPTRLVLVSNELPQFPDQSGAIATRPLIFRFKESFLGREDKGLDSRLEAELPSILIWSIEGWKRLRQRGRFLQPNTGIELINQMRDLSSPVGAFVRERCEIKSGNFIARSDLFEAWKDWCLDRGQDHGSDEAFGRNLRAVCSYLGTTQRRDKQGKRYRVYEGIDLLPAPACEELDHSPTPAF